MSKTEAGLLWRHGSVMFAMTYGKKIAEEVRKRFSFLVSSAKAVILKRTKSEYVTNL